MNAIKPNGVHQRILTFPLHVFHSLVCRHFTFHYTVVITYVAFPSFYHMSSLLRSYSFHYSVVSTYVTTPSFLYKRVEARSGALRAVRKSLLKRCSEPRGAPRRPKTLIRRGARKRRAPRRNNVGLTKSTARRQTKCTVPAIEIDKRWIPCIL